MHDDFEANSSAIWCSAKIRRAMRRSRRDVAREGGGGDGYLSAARTVVLANLRSERVSKIAGNIHALLF